jgi:hypothetical protein
VLEAVYFRVYVMHLEELQKLPWDRLIALLGQERWRDTLKLIEWTFLYSTDVISVRPDAQSFVRDKFEAYGGHCASLLAFGR